MKHNGSRSSLREESRQTNAAFTSSSEARRRTQNGALSICAQLNFEEFSYSQTAVDAFA